MQDTDSGSELIHLAETGLCEHGEQERCWPTARPTSTGRLPVNTDGGCLANGEPVGASGLRQVHEVVRQLQGRAAGAEVPGGPRVGFTHVYGAPGRVGLRRADRRSPSVHPGTPDLKAWRDEVRAWLAATLPPAPRNRGGRDGSRPTWPSSATSPTSQETGCSTRSAPTAGRASTPATAPSRCRSSTAAPVCRRRTRWRSRRRRRSSRSRRRRELISVTTGLVAPGRRDVRDAGAARRVRAAVPAHRPAGLPAVQRAGRRLRPGRARLPGGARRRRVGARRAEGVDLRGPARRSGLLLARTDPTCRSTRASPRSCRRWTLPA